MGEPYLLSGRAGSCWRQWSTLAELYLLSGGAGLENNVLLAVEQAGRSIIFLAVGQALASSRAGCELYLLSDEEGLENNVLLAVEQAVRTIPS